MSERLKVVIAGGTGHLGRSLAKALSVRHDVLSLGGESGDAGTWKVDLTSIPDTEVALAGADTLVFLARTSRQPARLTQAEWNDLDALMADSVARALVRTSVKRVVLFACGPNDVREALLRQTGVELAVLRGGGPQPVEALMELVEAAQAEDRALPEWVPPTREPNARRPGSHVVSVQRFQRPSGWSAEDVAWAYVAWLGKSVPLVSSQRVADTALLSAAGVQVLTLRKSPGRSEADSCWLDVADGALVGGNADGHFEFRVLLGGGEVMVALHDFEPALPWPVYRVTQAIAHGMVMKRFGRWLARQPAKSEANAAA